MRLQMQCRISEASGALGKLGALVAHMTVSNSCREMF